MQARRRGERVPDAELPDARAGVATRREQPSRDHGGVWSSRAGTEPGSRRDGRCTGWPYPSHVGALEGLPVDPRDVWTGLVVRQRFRRLLVGGTRTRVGAHHRLVENWIVQRHVKLLPAFADTRDGSCEVGPHACNCLRPGASEPLGTSYDVRMH